MNPTIDIVADRAALRLWDSAIVTLTVAGDAPLRIDSPREILTGESAGLWKVVPVGPPRVEPAGEGRERWTQKYECWPYCPPADAVPMQFASLRVTAGAATEAVSLPEKGAEKPLYFKVESSLVGAKAEDARPATGVEELPPLPVSPIGLPALWAITGGALVVMVAAVIALIRRRNRVLEPSPTAAALAELEALGDPPALDQVADILRQYLRRRFALPSDTATTTELLAVIRERTDWPTERIAELGTILDECDVVKFAIQPPNADAAATRDRALAWVTAGVGAGK